MNVVDPRPVIILQHNAIFVRRQIHGTNRGVAQRLTTGLTTNHVHSTGSDVARTVSLFSKVTHNSVPEGGRDRTANVEFKHCRDTSIRRAVYKIGSVSRPTRCTLGVNGLGPLVTSGLTKWSKVVGA